MYKEMKAVYDKTRFDVFAMAVSYLLDVGVRNIAKLTDEEIATFKGNGLMTANFVQDLAKKAREIAKVCEDNPVELIMFCEAEGIFDAEGYKQR